MNKKTVDELEKAAQQFKDFDQQVKSLTLDKVNEAPTLELEQQTKLSSREIANIKAIYLKPVKTIGPAPCEKFNEKWRSEHNFKTEYVNFIAENKEILGEDIEIWTKPFPGMDLEFWRVPVNKPVWGPRHLAEQIKKCSYHTFKTDQSIITESHGMGSNYGAMVAKHTVNRLDAIPFSERKSLFMGSQPF